MILNHLLETILTVVLVFAGLNTWQTFCPLKASLRSVSQVRRKFDKVIFFYLHIATLCRILY